MINKLLNNIKIRKIKKIAKKGSYLSKLNVSDITNELTNKVFNKKNLLNKLNIEAELSYYINFGGPDKKIKETNFRLKTIKDIEVIWLSKKKSLLKIPENLYNNFNAEEKSNFITTSLGIYTLINND